MAEKKENKIDTSELEGKTKDQIAKERKKLRNEVTHKLRFEVLERDNYTCRYCGRSPKTNPGLELAVDHVVPIEAGGKNELSNLVTACHSCNEGKKNKRLDADLPEKVWKFDYKEIIRVAEDSSNEEMSKFFLNPAHEEDRNFMYQKNIKDGKAFCVSDCIKCIESGVHFYRECFKVLHSEIVGDALVKIGPREIESAIGSREDTLACDFCYISSRCPKYKVGAKCAYNFSPDIDFSDTTRAYQLIASIQSTRVIRGTFFEKKDGGAIDKNVSSEIGLLINLVDRIENSKNPNSLKINMEGKGEGVNPIAELFKNILGNKDKEVKVDNSEDANYEEV